MWVLILDGLNINIYIYIYMGINSIKVLNFAFLNSTSIFSCRSIFQQLRKTRN